MSKFTGFSDADIQKLQNGEHPITKKSENESQSRPKVNLGKQKKPNRTGADFRKQNALTSKMSLNEPTVIPEEAKLFQPPPTQQVHEVKGILRVSEAPESTEEAPSNKPVETDKKFVDLEEFLVRQKLMEEQNRRRKEVLTKTLEDRTRQTLEEQQRLNEIQTEFRKLDANLSNDVKILRAQIEGASLEYMEAQKRYNRLEKEFLDAKLYLHQKLERKEMLTEYLCAIIEKNEERKAGKLDELLQKLNMDDGGTGVQSGEVSTTENGIE